MRRAGETSDDAREATAEGKPNSDDDARGLNADADEDAPASYDDEPATEGSGEHGRSRGEVSTRVIDALPGSPHLWTTVCAACLVVSAALILKGQAEAAFVTAAVGVLAWFINVRNRLRGDDDSAATNSGGRGGNEHESNGVRND